MHCKVLRCEISPTVGHLSVDRAELCLITVIATELLSRRGQLALYNKRVHEFFMLTYRWLYVLALRSISTDQRRYAQT